LFLVRNIIFFVLILDTSTTIGQWTQWGGAFRNFQADPVNLKLDWPKEGPKEIWSRALGDGYSAISVSDGKLYTSYRRGDNEVVTAIDSRSGKTIWEYAYAAPVWDGFEGFQDKYGPGPIATPLIKDNFVYAIGALTDLVCLGKNTGKKIWAHNLWKEFNSPPAKRGYASSPLFYKNTVIVLTVAKGRGAMAFDLKTGAVVWEGSDFKNRFSSPIIANVDGQDQLIMFVAEYLAGLDPNNGDLLWKYPHATQWNVHAMTPLWGDDNILFVSSSYDAGGRALRLRQQDGKTNVEELWFNTKVRVQHANAVRRGPFILTSSGDFGPGLINMIEAVTGELIVQKRGFAKSNLIISGDNLIVLDENGKLGIAVVRNDGLEIKCKATVFSGTAWTVPTLVGANLYLRDRKVIKALDLSAESMIGGQH
jgi:outer membrane protein assembly factor BamB